MTEAEVCAAIESYFETNWSATPILYDQVPGSLGAYTSSSVGWDESYGDQWDEAFGADWAAGAVVTLRVVFAGTNQTSIGTNPGWRGACLIQFDINTPLRTGTRRAVELGDQVSELFLGKDLSGVTVRDKVIFQTVLGSFYRRVIRFNGFYTYTH